MGFNKDSQIWSGEYEKPLYNPKISAGAVVLELLRKNPSKIGQVSLNRLFKKLCEELCNWPIKSKIEKR